MVRSDAFYRTTVRRLCVLRMWGMVLTRSSSRHHFLKCLVRLVRWGETLVHQNTSNLTQDGHCPGSIVVNLRFARGVWWGSVLRHHSFSAHVRRVRARETPGGWYWWQPVTAPLICFCFRFFRTSLSFGFPSSLRPSLRYDERAYLRRLWQGASVALPQAIGAKEPHFSTGVISRSTRPSC